MGFANYSLNRKLAFARYSTKMSWRRRATRDIAEMRGAGLHVYADGDEGKGEEGDMEINCFRVDFAGPSETPYEGCTWALRFTLPEQFPFKSPSVGFVQRIYHPNIDEASGSVCLDALNSAWSPSFTLAHIVQELLPYLLRYPNPSDPLNREAAALLANDAKAFEAKARKHSQKNARRTGVVAKVAS